MSLRRGGMVNQGASLRGAQHRIVGAARGKTDGRPLKGLIVKVFDEKFTKGKPLATAVTDDLGKYDVKIKPSALNERLRARGEPQKFLLRFFNRSGQLIKSTAQPVVINPNTDARVDLYQLPSEVDPHTPTTACGFGKYGELSITASRLSGKELVEAYFSWRNGVPVYESLNAAQEDFVKLLSQDKPVDDCAEGFFSAIKSQLKKRGHKRMLRLLTETVRVSSLDKQFFTEHVVVRYTLSGPSGVNSPAPTVTAPLRMPNGVLVGFIGANLAELHADNSEVPPVYVQQVGLIAEYAWNHFVKPPLSLRDPRGYARRVEIRIQRVPDATGATDAELDWIDIRPINSLDQNFATVPHELFHRVQYRYNSTNDRSGLYSIMREGGARFIEDSFNDDYNRYAFQAQEIFNNPAQSLVNPPEGCNNPIRYAAALFWKYLAEQHSRNTTSMDEPDIGFDVYRQVLETTATGASGEPLAYDPLALRTACSQMAHPGSFDEFSYFDDARTQLDTNETTWGNYLIANYLHGQVRSPLGEHRFMYMEDHEGIKWPYVTSELSRVEKLAALSARVAPEDDLVLNSGTSISRTVIGQQKYAARYYRITPGASSPSSLRVSVSAYSGMRDPLVQILLIGSGPILSDISRSDKASYTKTINMRGLSSVVVIVASRIGEGDYSISFEEVPGGPDVMLTRWNSLLLTEYEIYPHDQPHRRISPDIMVDTNDDFIPDEAISPNVNNKLKVRLHNRGSAEADGVHVEMTYQKTAPQLNPKLWLPIRNAANVKQTVTGLRLEAAGSPGDEKWVVMDWSPNASGPNAGWCVKAKVRSRGDLNDDNNIAMGCFAQTKDSSSGAEQR